MNTYACEVFSNKLETRQRETFVMKRKSEATKILAARDYHKGKKVADICRKYNCTKSTFYTWVRPYIEKKKINMVQSDLRIFNSPMTELES